MIRNRRNEDLDRLVDVLGQLDGHVGVLAGGRPRDWLQDVEAERAWVFDQAPVSAAPTKNVVGHIQIYRMPETNWAGVVLTRTGRRSEELMVIGRLFAKPVKHNYGILRYLLKEAVKWIESSGCLAVLDPDDVAMIPTSLYVRLGFVEVHGTDRGIVDTPVLVRPRSAEQPETMTP